MQNIDKLEEQLKTARESLAEILKQKEGLVGTLSFIGAKESVVTNSMFGFDRQIHKFSSQIASLKKQLGYPTEKEEKLRKARLKAAMNELPDDVKNAKWGTLGKDGNEPLRYVPLIECDTVHLGLILVQLIQANDLRNRYVSYIQQILEARKHL